MTKPLTLSTQKVAAVLRKAGFKASQSNPTRVRGLRTRTPGYVTIKGANWVGVSTCGYPDEVAARVLDKCRDNIRDAGLAVSAVDGTMFYVTLPEATNA